MKAEREQQNSENVPESATAEKPVGLAVDATDAGALSKVQSIANEGDWQQSTQETFNWMLKEFPEQFNKFVNEYQKPLIIAGAAGVTVFGISLATSILNVINSVPLFAAFFELVGFGFSGWFAYRYLLFATRREEFTQAIDVLKTEILGNKDAADK
jgi:CAAD domains of cyanobacterial aminoacyl-tRNA synthetase